MPLRPILPARILFSPFFRAILASTLAAETEETRLSQLEPNGTDPVFFEIVDRWNASVTKENDVLIILLSNL